MSKPSKMRPRSCVASAPAQKEHRVASKNGTSAHTHARTYACEARPSRQATIDFVEKSSNRCSEAQDFEGLQGHGGNATHGPMATTPHNTQRAKPGLNKCPQPQAKQHVTLNHISLVTYVICHHHLHTNVQPLHACMRACVFLNYIKVNI